MNPFELLPYHRATRGRRNGPVPSARFDLIQSRAGMLISANLGLVQTMTPTDMPEGWYQVRGSYLVPVELRDTDEPWTPTPPGAATGMVAVDPWPALAIDRAMLAAADDEARMILCAIRVETDGAWVRFVATDGHRLAVSAVPWERPDGLADFSANIPADAFRILAARPPAGGLLIMAHAGGLALSNGEATVTVRPIDGAFPVYGRVIPSRIGWTAAVPKAALAAALAYADADRETGIPRVRICHEPEAGRFAVSGGRGRTAYVPAMWTGGGPIARVDLALVMPMRLNDGTEDQTADGRTFGMSPGLLTDAIRHIPGPVAYIGQADNPSGQPGPIHWDNPVLVSGHPMIGQAPAVRLAAAPAGNGSAVPE